MALVTGCRLIWRLILESRCAMDGPESASDGILKLYVYSRGAEIAHMR